MAISMLEEILLCGVTAELFDRDPPDGIPEGPGDPSGPVAIPFRPATTPFGAGVDWSERCESAIPVSLRFQFWIIADAGLVPGFTGFICELAEDFSSAESNQPGGAGDGAVGDIGLVDVLGMGGEGREKVSGSGLEMRAVFPAVDLAASSAACLSAFCCLKILSTLYPRRLSALRSVDSIVMNNSASLTFGASNSKRHKEIEISYIST
jgi:hypothetical protein